MEKKYLKPKEFQEGDIIYFDIPSFCTGEYKAKVCRDEIGLFINKSDDYFSRSNDYRVNKPYWSKEYQ